MATKKQKKQKKKQVTDVLPESLERVKQNSLEGMTYKALISELKPTQNAVGYDETSEKKDKLEKKSKKKLRNYLLQRPIPIIIGNGGYYMIDHHHLAFAAWYAFDEMYLPVEVIQNWSVIKDYSFWKALLKNNWLYPFGGDGRGPLPPNQLKEHIKDLENDVFRSLSWYVRKKFGYVKSQNPIFAEFKWANFYRTRIKFKDQLKENINITKILLNKLGDREEIIDFAMYLATSEEARGLPGYRGS